MKLFQNAIIISLFLLLSCTDKDAFDVQPEEVIYSPGIAAPIGTVNPGDTLNSLIETYVLPMSYIADCVLVYMEDVDFDYKIMAKEAFNLDDMIPIPFELDTYSDEADNIEYVTFYLNIINGYPLPATFKVIAKDPYGFEINTLFDINVSQGKTKNNIVTEANYFQTATTFYSDEIADLFDIKNIEVESEVIFTEESLDILRIKSDYKLTAQLALKIKLNTDLGSITNFSFK